jgi:hypothetical protein
MIGTNGNGVIVSLSFWNRLHNAAPGAFKFLGHMLGVPEKLMQRDRDSEAPASLFGLGQRSACCV